MLLKTDIVLGSTEPANYRVLILRRGKAKRFGPVINNRRTNWTASNWRHSSLELPRTRGEFTARVECNPDEVVTGGGFAASPSPQFTSPTGILKESRKAFNG